METEQSSPHDLWRWGRVPPHGLVAPGAILESKVLLQVCGGRAPLQRTALFLFNKKNHTLDIEMKKIKPQLGTMKEQKHLCVLALHGFSLNLTPVTRSTLTTRSAARTGRSPLMGNRGRAPRLACHLLPSTHNPSQLLLDMQLPTPGLQASSAPPGRDPRLVCLPSNHHTHLVHIKTKLHPALGQK